MTSVYIMTNDLGLTKIGISNNPKKRQAQLKNASGFDVVIEWVSERMGRDDATHAERKAHDLLKDKRMKGEWFSDLTPSEAVSVLTNHVGLKKMPLDNIFGTFTCSPEMSTELFDIGYEGLITVSDNDDVRFYSGSKPMVNCPWFKGRLTLDGFRGHLQVDGFRVTKGFNPYYVSDSLRTLASMEQFADDFIGSYTLKEYQEAIDVIMEGITCDWDGRVEREMFDRDGTAIKVDCMSFGVGYGVFVFASKSGGRNINPFPDNETRVYSATNGVREDGDGYQVNTYNSMLRLVMWAKKEVGNRDLLLICRDILLHFETWESERLEDPSDFKYIRFKFNGKEYSHEELPLSEAVQINIDLIEFI